MRLVEKDDVVDNNGIFLSMEEAKLIRDAFHKNPLECSSEEEWASIRDAVRAFCKMAGEQ